MKITTLRVLANHFDQAVAFYRDILRIPIRADAGAYVAFDVGGFELGIYSRELMSQIVSSMPEESLGSSDSLLINLEVDDLVTTVASLQERGVTFETEIHDQLDWGMRVVHLRDPEGNLLELYERLPLPD